MFIAILQLPVVKRRREERPRKCIYCEGGDFLRWGPVQKPATGCTLPEYIGVSVSLLQMWEDVSALSGRDTQADQDM